MGVGWESSPCWGKAPAKPGNEGIVENGREKCKCWEGAEMLLLGGWVCWVVAPLGVLLSLLLAAGGQGCSGAETPWSTSPCHLCHHFLALFHLPEQ